MGTHCQPGLAVGLMGSRKRGTAVVSFGRASLMEPSVLLKPSSQPALPVLRWVQQKHYWSSQGRGLQHWLCEFILSDGSSLGTDFLLGSPRAVFLYCETHLKNVCLLIVAVSRGLAISLLSISVPSCYTRSSLRHTCSTSEGRDSTPIVTAS